MFNVNRIEWSQVSNNNHNIIKYYLRLDNESEELYNIIAKSKEGGNVPFVKALLKVDLKFNYNTETSELDLVELFVNDNLKATTIPLNSSNLTKDQEISIKNRLLELFDFSESIKEEVIFDIVSNALSKVIDKKKGVDIASSKNDTYSFIILDIKSELNAVLPLHDISCIPIYSGKQRNYGVNWKLKIQTTIEDKFIVTLTLPIVITLNINKNNGICNYYALKDIELLDTEHLTKTLIEYENEIVQNRIARMNEEQLKEDERRKSLILEKKSNIELCRKNLSLLDSENILKSSLKEILSSSTHILNDEQNELFTRCESILDYMSSYIYLTKELSKKENR